MTVDDLTWINVLSALLTPVIAIAVAVIAYLQWATNHSRLKLELFERRYILYQAARTLIGDILRDGAATNEGAVKFLRATTDAEFLLNDDLAAYLDELYKKAVEMSSLEERKRSLPTGKKRDGYNDRDDRLLGWFLEQNRELSKNFARCLSLRC